VFWANSTLERPFPKRQLSQALVKQASRCGAFAISDPYSKQVWAKPSIAG
jgi:hypothetical protein